MKNKSKLYAKALAEVLAKEPASAKEATAWQSNFVTLLVKAGQEKRAKEILNLAEEMLLAKQGKNKITFETARKMTAIQKKVLSGFVKDGDLLKEKINPELIAGVKIIINNNKQFDASLKSKLNKIL
jgi:F0F1-type ATP synthase delta subunit